MSLSNRSRSFRILVVPAVFLALASAASAAPSIGGTPTLTDTDVFSSFALDWEVTVHSYAFVGTNGVDDIPAGLPEPALGQTLFAYVPDASDSATSAVDQFQVGDPFGFAISVAGFSPAILPAPGYVEADRQNPSGTQVSLPALSVTYLYNGANTLDAGEFSVLYFLADGVPSQVPATVRGGASITDFDTVLGPIPEPTTLGLLAVAALGLGRRK